MALEIQRRKSIFGPPDYLVVVDTEPQTLAHVGFEVVASVLGAVLRKAFNEHLQTCPSCSDPKIPIFDCAEGQALVGTATLRRRDRHRLAGWLVNDQH